MVRVSNENEVAAYHVIRVILATIFTAYVVTIWLFSGYFSWSNNATIRMVGHGYGIFYLVMTLLVWLKGGIWYVEFTFKDEMYQFKYYILTTPFGSRKMIRIPAENLYAFIVESSLLGLRKKLILFQEREGKVFQYPPIPIGSLFSDKRSQVFQELEKYGILIKSRGEIAR